jgi:hypothetical protein
MFLALLLAVRRRLAVILVSKVRSDGSSTVGNSCCGVKSIRSFATSMWDCCWSLVVARPSFGSGRLSLLGCHFCPQGSFGRIVHGRQLVLRREKHPILRYVHVGLLLDVGRRPPIFWSAVIVRTKRPLEGDTVSQVSIM